MEMEGAICVKGQTVVVGDSSEGKCLARILVKGAMDMKQQLRLP